MSRSIYHFRDCTFDPSARELRRAGKLLSLSPQVFDCIAYLIEKRDRAVGRDELIAAVWGKVDVADSQFRRIMRKSRSSVGESGDGQIIHTLPRFGFRWVAELSADVMSSVEIQSSTNEALPIDTPPGSVETLSYGDASDVLPAVSIRSRGLRRPFTVFLALLVLAAGLYGCYVNRDNVSTILKLSVPRDQDRGLTDVIAVMPVNIVGVDEADSAWMRLGLMDLIARHLHGAALVVVPSSEVVSLVRNDPVGDVLVDKVRLATGAKNVVVAYAARTNDTWALQLELHGRNGELRTVVAQSANAILAADEISNRLLELLGKRSSPEPTKSVELPVVELLQRTKAALLVDDFKTAGHLVESAPKELHDLPEVQLDEALIELGLDHFEVAQKEFSSLLNNTPAETDPVLRARILSGLGATMISLNQLNLAERQFSEAIALVENRAEPTFLGSAFLGRGLTYYAQGRYEEAASEYSRARLVFELAGDTLALARVDANEAALDNQINRPTDALLLLDRATQRLEPFGATDQLALDLINEISVHSTMLQPAKALAVNERVGTKFDNFQGIGTLHLLRYSQAVALAENGRLTKANLILDELTRTVSPTSEGRLLASIQGEEARLALLDDQPDTAAVLSKRAIDMWTMQKFPRECSGDWVTLIRALRKLKRNVEADAEVHRFSKCADSAEDAQTFVYVRIVEAEQAWGEGKHKEAIKIYDKALRSAHQLDVPVVIADVALSYGNALLSVGEAQLAAEVVGQIDYWSYSDFQCALLKARLYRTLGGSDVWRTALEQARALAGERRLPPDLILLPSPIAIAQQH